MYKSILKDKLEISKNYQKITCTIFHFNEEEDFDTMIWLAKFHNDSNFNKSLKLTDKLKTLHESYVLAKPKITTREISYSQRKFENLHIISEKPLPELSFSQLTEDQRKVITSSSKSKIKYGYCNIS